MGEFTEADVARALEGLCPYCGKGPYKLLSNHVSHLHGIDSRRFKDDLGVPWGTPLCSPEFSERLRERNIATGTSERILAHHSGGTPGRKISKAAREKFRANLAKVTTEEARQRGLVASWQPEARAKMAASLTKNPDHGTEARYKKGCRCDECRIAHAQDARERKSRAEGRDVPPRRKPDEAPHGTRTRYEKAGCRCDECRASNTERGRAYRARRKAG